MQTIRTDHIAPRTKDVEGISAILGLDIGGTFLKMSVIKPSGEMITPWKRAATPDPATPESVLNSVRQLMDGLPDFEVISVGFPGVVRDGVIFTAPNLGNEFWNEFDLAGTMLREFGKPVRVLNDAIVQGLGVVEAAGLSCVLTLGTGMGCALFRDRQFIVQLELGRHIATGTQCYDVYVGHAAYASLPIDEWNARVKSVLDWVRNLVNFEHLYLGGGNARRISFELPSDVTIIPMTAGITGGARLWEK
jgi:polyphosphate glucokinase